MVQIVGTYKHIKNENLDEYFKIMGMPYIARKMVGSTSPTLEIKNAGDEYTITMSTLLKTTVYAFKLGQEYEEQMPGGAIKSVTTLEENKLVTHSVGPNDTKFTRIYDFGDDGCVIIMKHEASGIEAKRYFKRE